MQLHDAIVQGLAVASYALDLKMGDMAEEALSQTLTTAREMVAALLEKAGGHGSDPAELLGAEVPAGPDKPAASSTS